MSGTSRDSGARPASGADIRRLIPGFYWTRRFVDATWFLALPVFFYGLAGVYAYMAGDGEPWLRLFPLNGYVCLALVACMGFLLFLWAMLPDFSGHFLVRGTVASTFTKTEFYRGRRSYVICANVEYEFGGEKHTVTRGILIGSLLKGLLHIRQRGSLLGPPKSPNKELSGKSVEVLVPPKSPENGRPVGSAGGDWVFGFFR